MRRLLGVFAALALLAAGAFSFARISAAQDDPELAARASEYVQQKFGVSEFFSDVNEAGRERRVHQMVLFPDFGTYPMILWGEWHGDWKTDQFGLERQRYAGYSLRDESVTNPMFPPDSQGSGALDAQNWIPYPWDNEDVRQQHPNKVKDKKLDGNSDPEIVFRMQDGLMFTAWFNGYDFPARDSDLYLNPQKYVHIYIPPAPNVWGMGVMFRYKGQSVWYVSVPLGPPVPDCGVRLEPSERQAKPGDAVSFTLKVSFRKMYDSHLGGRVYLSHRVGENAYPVPFSLDGRQSETNAQLGAAYLDVVPGGDRDYQGEVTVHAQDVGSTLAAWVVPGWRTGAGEFRFLEGYDSDPSNNRAEAKIIVDQPNLKVRNLTLDPNPASPGDAVVARAEIVNEGSQDVTTVARWIFEGQVLAEQEISIPAGGYNVTRTRIRAPQEPATYAVGMLANPNHDRPANEKTYDDNYAEGYLTVEEPCTDISVQLGLSSAGVPNGGTVTAYVTVRRANDGPDRPVSVRASVAAGGASKTWTLQLRRGEERSLSATFQVNNVGRQVTFRAEAWPQGIEDCAPGNNTDSETIGVEPPPPGKQPDPGIFVRLIA